MENQKGRYIMKKQWGKLLSGLLCMMLLVTALALPAQAACEHTFRNNTCTQCGQIGGICGIDATWNYDPDSNTLRILGSGAMINYSLESPVPWNIYKDEIKTIKIADEITSIGAYAFYGCSKVKIITIPMEATSVDPTAFYECTNLRWIEVASGNDSFSYDEHGALFSGGKTTLYVLPASFQGEYEIPKKVTTISSGAFNTAHNLTAIRVHEDNKKFVSDENGFLFNKEMTKLVAVPMGYQGDCFIPATVESLSTTALANCPGLTGIYVEPGNENYSSSEQGLLLNETGTKILLCPSALEGICKIPASVTTWDYKYTFDKCPNITGFQVEEGSEKLSHDENGYLYNLEKTKLMKVPTALEGTCHIAATVSSMETYAILDSYGITAYEVAQDNKTYSNDAQGVLFNKKKTKLVYCPLGFTGAYTVPDTVTSLGTDSFYDCQGLTEVILPDTLTTIGNWSFAKCANLANVKLPKSLKTVGNYAFAYCPNQTSAEFSDEVTSIGQYAFASCTGLTTASIPNGFTVLSNGMFKDCTALNEVSFPDSITTIGAYCFYRCYNLENIPIPEDLVTLGSHAFTFCENQASADLPKTVTSVGSYAFAFCPSLTSAYIPDGVTELVGVFQACGNLETVRLHDGLKTIGDYCFQKCFKLEHMEFPKNLETVGFYAFSNCPNQRHANLPDTVTAIGQNAFSYCTGLKTAELPEGFQVLRSYTFRGCTALESVYIPDSVNVIGSHSFRGCTSLVEVDIPDGVTLIESYAFYNCEKLENVKIPSALEELQGSAFYRCKAITEVTIPAGVTKLNQNVFYGCSNLRKVVLPDTLTEIAKYAFYECKKLQQVNFPKALEEIGTRAFWYCEGLTEVILPDSLKVLGDSSFRYCTNVEKVYVPGSVEEVNSMPFFGCYKLTNVTLEDGIPVIGEYMFYGCAALESIEIPESVTSIGPCAFQACTALKNVKVPSKVEKVNFMAFESCTNLQTIALPVSLKTIDDGAFYNAVVADVLYEGTEEQWGKVRIGGDNDPIETARFHYESGKVDKHEISELTEAPTCTAQGSIYMVCTCGLKETLSVLDKLDHIPEKIPGVAPTCAETGLTDGERCSQCGETLTPQEEIPVTQEHAYETKVVAPTAVGKGYTLYTCKICGHSYEDDETPALGLFAPKIKSVASTSGKPTITWEAMEEGVEYEIYRANSKNGAYEAVCITGENTFADTSAKMGKTYYYKVKALYNNQFSGFSNTVSATCKCGQPALKLSTTASSGKVKLSWGKISGAKKYEVYRSTKATSGFKKLTSTTKTYYTDSSAKVGTTYYYKVRTIGSKSSYNSDYSQTLKGIRICGQTDLAVKLNTTTGKPNLSWDKVSGASKYLVYRATTEDGQYELIKTTTGTSYKDTKAETDQDYYYRVNAIGSKSTTESVPEKAIKVHTTCAVPSISVKNDKASGDPVISWKAVEGAVKYKVYRSSKSSSGFKSVGTTEELNFRDTTASTGKKYYYKVKAVCESGASSSYSSVKNGYSKCAAPEVEITLSGKKPKLTWSKVSGAKKYEVYRATSKSGSYKKIKTTSSTMFTDSSAKKGKTYYYKVKVVASTSSANSDYSTVVSMKSN